MYYNIADIDLTCNKCNSKFYKNNISLQHIKYSCIPHNCGVMIESITDRSEKALVYYFMNYNYDGVEYRLYGSVRSNVTYLFGPTLLEFNIDKILFPNKINNESFYKIFLRLLKILNYL